MSLTGLVKPSTETPNIQVWTLDILCPEQYLTDQLKPFFNLANIIKGNKFTFICTEYNILNN